jgi:hypothetical protein
VETVEATNAPMGRLDPSGPSDAAKEKKAGNTTKKTRSDSSAKLSVRKSGGLGGDSWTPRI